MNTGNSDSCRIALLVATAATAAIALSACGKQESAPPSASTAAAAHEDHSSHTAPTLPEGKLWPTDAPLRAAMGRIQSAVEQSETSYSSGTFKEADAQSLAAQVEKDVRYMIENCKLEPEPDAALHLLIARMTSAVASLKTNPTSAEGVPALAAVVHDYRATFDATGVHEPN